MHVDQAGSENSTRAVDPFGINGGRDVRLRACRNDAIRRWAQPSPAEPPGRSLVEP